MPAKTDTDQRCADFANAAFAALAKMYSGVAWNSSRNTLTAVLGVAGLKVLAV
jgi:hypothetical protein